MSAVPGSHLGGLLQANSGWGTLASATEHLAAKKTLLGQPSAPIIALVMVSHDFNSKLSPVAIQPVVISTAEPPPVQVNIPQQTKLSLALNLSSSYIAACASCRMRKVMQSLSSG